MKARLIRFIKILMATSGDGLTMSELRSTEFQGGIPLRKLQRDVRDLIDLHLIDILPSADHTQGPRYRSRESYEQFQPSKGPDFPHALAAKLAFDHARQVIPSSIADRLAAAQKRNEFVLARGDKSTIPWFEKVATRPLGLPLEPAVVDEAILRTVTESLGKDQQLAFDYKVLEKPVSPRVVNPLGLLSRPPRLYLVAMEMGSEVVKRFSVARMHNVRLLLGRVERPSEPFQEYVKSRRALFLLSDRMLDLRLRATRDVAEQMSETPIAGTAIELHHGHWEIRTLQPLAHSRELVSFLLAWEDKIEVLEPAWFRAEMAGRIAAMAARYTPASQTESAGNISLTDVPLPSKKSPKPRRKAATC